MRARSAEVCLSMSMTIALGAIGVYVGRCSARRSRSIRADGPASIRSRSWRQAALATSSSRAATRAANSACFLGLSARHCLWCSCLASWAFNLGNSSGLVGGQIICPRRWPKGIALPAASMPAALRAGIAASVTVRLKWVNRRQSGKSFGTRLTQEYAG